MLRINFKEIPKVLCSKICTKITSKIREIEDISEILSFDREVMSRYNIWPIDQVEIRFLLLTIMTQLVPSYAFCLRRNLNMMQLAYGVLPLIAMHIFILGYLNSYLQRDKLKILLINLRQAWTISLLEDLPEWHTKHKRLQKFTIIYEKITILYAKIGAPMYCLAPVILSLYKKFNLNWNEPELQLIMNFNFYFVDVRDHLVAYLIYIIVFTHFFYRTGIVTQAIANVNTNLLLHIGKYFEFVEVKLKALNYELLQQDIQDEQLIFRRLRNIVDLHNQAIDFVRQIESVLSPILLFTYLINTFTFCFISFNLLTSTGEFDKTASIQMILLLIFCTYLTFVPSYACDKIIENNTRIGVEAYNLKWYGKSPTITKMLQMIIVRSQKTVGLRAGKFYFVSLNSFASMLNSAISYYTLLRTVYAP